MATSLAVALALTLKTTYTNAYGITDNLTEDIVTKTISDSLADGVIVDTANVVWHNTATLANSTTSLDLVSALTDSYGNAITFAKVKGILLHNKETTAGNFIQFGGIAACVPVLVSTAPAAEFPCIVVHPGGLLFLWNPSLAGWAVTGGTGDLIYLKTVTVSVTYDLVIIGTK